MTADNRSQEELLTEIESLRFRLEEAEETLRVIHSGEVDALVVSSGPGASQVFTLQGAEHPYRVLVETMQEGAALLATDGLIGYCNQRLADMLQTPLEKLIGSPLVACVDSQDQAQVAAWLANPAAQREPAEITLKTPAGNTLAVLLSASAVELKGKPGIGMVFTDISAIKAAERRSATAAERERTAQAIQESEERLRFALDAAKMGVFDWDLASAQVIWTPRTEEIYGFNPGEFDGTYAAFARRIHPEDLPTLERTMAQASEDRSFYLCEHRAVWPDGSLHWVISRGVFSYAGNGQPAHMRGTAVDITVLKQAEEASREHAIIHELYHRLDRIASRAPGLIYQFKRFPDGSFCIPYASEAIRNIYRVSPEAVRGDASAAFAQHHPEDNDAFFASIQQSAATLQPWQHEFRLRFADGTVRWLFGNSTPTQEADGSILWDGFITDITKIKQTEQALRESENKFSKIFHDSPIGMVISTASDGKIMDANAAFSAIYGYERADIIGHSSVDMGLWDDPKQRECLIHQVLRQGSVANFEVGYQRKSDGTNRTLLASMDTIEVAGEPCIVGLVLDITDRKLAEMTIAESRNLLQTIIDTAPLRVFWKDRKLRFIGCNMNFAKDAGVAHPNEVIGKDDFQLAWAEQAELYRADDRAVMESAISKLSYDEPQRTPKGELIWLRTSKVPLRNPEGEIIGMLGMYEDITQYKQVELALRESESRFRMMANAAPVLIWVAGTDKRRHWFNQVWLDFTGRTMTEEQGNGWTEGAHPDDLQECFEIYASHFDRRKGFQMEYRLLRHDGEYRWIHDHGVPLQDGQGNFAGYIGSCIDITPSKELTIRLSNALTDLGTQTSRLKTLLETASDGIHIMDMQGNLIQFSDSFATMLGYTHAETAKLNISNWDALISKEQQQEIIKGLFNQPKQFETKHRRKDGSLIDVEINAKGVLLEGNRYVYASSRDITERKWLETQLAASAAEIEDLYENAPCGYHSSDKDGTYLRINATELAWLGCRREEVIGRKKPTDFFTPASKEIFATEYSSFVDCGYINNLEIDMLGNDGNIRHISLNATAIRDSDGSFLKSRSIFYDITEIKKARERLEHLMHEQQVMLDNELVGIMRLKGRHTVWLNKAMEHIFGYASSEINGQTSRILFADDADYERLCAAARPILKAQGIYRTQLVMVKQGGEKLWIDASGVRLPNTDDEFLWMLADLTLIKKYQDKIEQIAFHDSLTGLPNRLLITDRLHQALALAERSNQMLALGYLDLDGFKPVNDTYGHEAGDKLLMEVARRLQTGIRANDTAGRLGGDEFVLLLTNLESPEELSGVLRRVMEAINQPVALDGSHEATVSASIGIALFPQDGTDPDALLRHADQAMYAAKQSGKNRYSLFDVNQDAAVKAVHENRADIRRALDRHEFVLHYQPKVNLKTRAVIGVEALIRWQHPQRGLLHPAEFMPIIENHAYGIELGEWVIDAAFAQLAAWHEQRLDLPVSMNIAAYHLQHDGFVPNLRARFAAYPAVRPDHVELEVLESSALEDVGNVCKIMQACCEMGVHFALDDFGTGYSPLTCLKRLPVDTLKIDQSFIHNMLHDADDLSIIEGVIGLAKSFRRLVIAEGVETAGHGERLLALGCDSAQGYAIAKPMPATELPGWVAAWQ